MAGKSWLVDKSRFATKIKCASGASDPSKTQWMSNPSRSCPKCHHTINNDEIVQDWPGLPRGVKFDPSDQEIIWHLLAKVGFQNMQPHPFIDEFIPTVHEEDGICYTHPQNLPGVRQDGGACHFFHRAIKAYNTGTRKRRKIHGDDLGDVRWHKTGRTRPVIIGGVQRGCKKIMVLYMSPLKGGKAEKTNWVMHQYHLGTEEDEKDGEYVISKVSYQQQPNKQSDKVVEDAPDLADDAMLKVDPVTPKSVTPEPPRSEGRLDIEPVVQGYDHGMGLGTTDVVGRVELGITDDGAECEPGSHSDQQAEGDNGNEVGDEGKWWDSESQYLLNSQQLVEALSLCDDLFSSQPSKGDGNDNGVREEDKPRLSVYARLGAEDLKKDIEDCQNLVLDPANIYLDTPPDFRLSQLEFGSQDSNAAWGAGKISD